MNILTHAKISRRLCGNPVLVEEGHSRVEFQTQNDMVVDDFGLIHGGFVFGLADYAAMIAVNHPNVVLGSAEVKFLKPVRVDDQVVADATVTSQEGKKRIVEVNVTQHNDIVFSGVFTCFVLENHVLS